MIQVLSYPIFFFFVICPGLCFVLVLLFVFLFVSCFVLVWVLLRSGFLSLLCYLFSCLRLVCVFVSFLFLFLSHFCSCLVSCFFQTLGKKKICSSSVSSKKKVVEIFLKKRKWVFDL